MKFQQEWLAIVKAAGIFYHEHIFCCGMEVVILLADIAEVSEMMLVLIAKSRIHLVTAVRTTKSMTSATLA